MSELTPQEQALIVASAIGASVADLAAVLPCMTFSEREAILSQAKRLNALQGRTGEDGKQYPTYRQYKMFRREAGKITDEQ